MLSQHECVIMGDFNLPNIDWTLERQTPAPGNKLIQLLADNNLTQHVHATTRQNNILDLVISTEEELIANLKIIIIIIIYHDFLPTPRRGSHVKSGKTHTQSARYTP